MTTRMYQAMKDQVLTLTNQRQASAEPSREQYVDWTYGTTVVENPRMTIEIARAAVDAKLARRRQR